MLKMLKLRAVTSNNQWKKPPHGKQKRCNLWELRQLRQLRQLMLNVEWKPSDWLVLGLDGCCKNVTCQWPCLFLDLSTIDTIEPLFLYEEPF